MSSNNRPPSDDDDQDNLDLDKLLDGLELPEEPDDLSKLSREEYAAWRERHQQDLLANGELFNRLWQERHIIKAGEAKDDETQQLARAAAALGNKKRFRYIYAHYLATIGAISEWPNEQHFEAARQLAEQMDPEHNEGWHLRRDVRYSGRQRPPEEPR